MPDNPMVIDVGFLTAVKIDAIKGEISITIRTSFNPKSMDVAQRAAGLASMDIAVRVTLESTQLRLQLDSV